MNEQEAAAYYQQHKDDPDLWGDEEPSPVPPGAMVRVVRRHTPLPGPQWWVAINGWDDEDEEC
jgi:hypothetical protein